MLAVGLPLCQISYPRPELAVTDHHEWHIKFKTFWIFGTHRHSTVAGMTDLSELGRDASSIIQGLAEIARNGGPIQEIMSFFYGARNCFWKKLDQTLRFRGLKYNQINRIIDFKLAGNSSTIFT